jgi:hypothetical protein
MSIQFPTQPWQEGDTFVNDATGVEYTFDGVKWLASGGDAVSEQQPPAQVGKTPPENPVEGDLWFMSDVFLAEGEIPIELSSDKLFVYADGKWEPATSLQHERRMRELGDLDTRLDAEYYTERQDGKHITRLDKALLPEPVFVDKNVTVHDDGVIPPFNDDNLHFSDPTSKRSSTIAYKGEDPGPDIYYAIISHKSQYPSPRREEWIVKSVSYENGIVTIEADDPYGCVGASSSVYTATLWLLTQEDATELPFHSHDDQYVQKGHGHSNLQKQIDENADDLAQLAIGLQAISTPRCDGLWQFKGKLSDGPPRNNGEFSLIYDVDREDNFLTMITTDLNGEYVDLLNLVKPGDYAQVYDLGNPDSYTLHTLDDVVLGSINPEMVEMPCTLVAHGNELVKSDQCAIRFFAVHESPQVAENTEAIKELNDRLDALEEVMQPWTGLDIGTYATKAENYEPTGSSQAEGTAGMWWTNVHMNSTPNNHVRIGMQADPDMCTQIAAMPVPFEMDVIQPEAKQTWHVYEVYERGTGVLHVLNDVAWGDELTHSHIAVDTQYIVRKV